MEEEAPVVVFSAVADKKYEEMIQDLCTQIPARCYVVTEIEDKRRVPAEELKAVFERYTDRPVLERKELKDALRTAEQNRSKEGKIYCLGSLYLVGMLNFEEELKKFQPSLEVEDIEDAVYQEDLTDMTDILREMIEQTK